jgi:alpha-tubulin suppressor-like RCC1 family protein
MQFKRLDSLIQRGITIVDISQGYAHTTMLSKTGDLYVTGVNGYGQLALPRQIVYVQEPVRVQFEKFDDHKEKKIRCIASGYSHVLCETDRGELVGFGSNTMNQLGDPSLPDKVFQPVVTHIFYSGIKKIRCGQSFSAVLTSK